MNVIKVASNSRTSGVAGAIAHSLRENGIAHAQSIGAGAVNQMIKATILARQFLAQEGKPLVFSPDYVEVEINGQERTAVRLTITASVQPAGATPEVRETTTSEEIAKDFDERQKLSQTNNELLQKMETHHAESPTLSGGDVDAAWDQADTGEETVGGTTPTPDQDRVDELGEAVGLTYESDEPLQTAEKLKERDQHRWELDPESAADNEPSER